MLTKKVSEVGFSIDDYINILDFKDIIINDYNPYYVAAVVGYIENIIQINKDKEYLTFINMYQIKIVSKYKFMSLYNFLKNNSKCYEYIVKYFDMWHGNYEEFTYDDYNKRDLTNNYYELASLLIEERNLAFSCNDKETVEAYNYFLNKLSVVC